MFKVLSERHFGGSNSVELCAALTTCESIKHGEECNASGLTDGKDGREDSVEILLIGFCLCARMESSWF